MLVSQWKCRDSAALTTRLPLPSRCLITILSTLKQSNKHTVIHALKTIASTNTSILLNTVHNTCLYSVYLLNQESTRWMPTDLYGVTHDRWPITIAALLLTPPGRGDTRVRDDTSLFIWFVINIHFPLKFSGFQNKQDIAEIAEVTVGRRLSWMLPLQCLIQNISWYEDHCHW